MSFRVSFCSCVFRVSFSSCVLLVLRLPRLGKRELILVLFVRLFDLCLFGFVLGLGRAAVCDCGTPWTFLLPFYYHRCVNLMDFHYNIDMSASNSVPPDLISQHLKFGLCLKINRYIRCNYLNDVQDSTGSFLLYKHLIVVHVISSG